MKTPSMGPVTVLAPAVIAAVVLSACGAKPPACEDAAVVRTIQQLVLEPAFAALNLKNPRGYFIGPLLAKRQWRDADRAWVQPLLDAALARYSAGVETTPSMVTTDGYDSQARCHTCKATIRLQSKATGQTMEVRSVDYTVQGTAKDGEFQVALGGMDPFVTMVSRDAASYAVEAILQGAPADPVQTEPPRNEASAPPPSVSKGD
jgi:hypothetical protein